MQCHIVWHFIRVCTVCQDRFDLQIKKQYFFDIITCDHFMISMEYSDFIICSFMENSIGLKRVKRASFLMKNLFVVTT